MTPALPPPAVVDHRAVRLAQAERARRLAAESMRDEALAELAALRAGRWPRVARWTVAALVAAMLSKAAMP